LEARADTAVGLYNKAKVTRILISGDGTTESYNEVDTTARYILNAGVARDKLLLDYSGVDTYTSMLHIHALGIRSVVIVTQDFHLPRALFLAHVHGIRAYGVPADNTDSRVFNYIREIPASIKAILQAMALVASRAIDLYR
jgi:SanA protein